MSIIHNPEDANYPGVLTNIPECVFFLKCEETGAAITTLTDAISGGTLTVVASASIAGGGIKIPSGGNSAFSGTLPALSGDFAVLALATLNATAVGSLKYSSTGQLISIASTGASIVGVDGTATIDSTTLGKKSKCYIKSDADADCYLWQEAPGTALANTLNPLAADHGAFTPGANTMQFSGITGDATVSLYGYAVFDLSGGGIEDMDIWADWILEQWNLSNMVLPKALEYIS